MDDTRKHLLLSYIHLIAERNAYGPGSNFEYLLFDDMANQEYTLVSKQEADEITFLAESTDCWVCFNLETRMLELISIDEWHELVRQIGN
jgi:hypothetical protein